MKDYKVEKITVWKVDGTVVNTLAEAQELSEKLYIRTRCFDLAESEDHREPELIAGFIAENVTAIKKILADAKTNSIEPKTGFIVPNGLCNYCNEAYERSQLLTTILGDTVCYDCWRLEEMEVENGKN